MNADVDVIDHDLKISGVDPDLIISASGTGDPAILFGDNGQQADARIWYSSDDKALNLGTSTINASISIDNDDRVGINLEADDIESQLTVKANAGNTQVPAHLELRENNNSQGGRIHMTNSNKGYWEIHGDPNGTTAGELDFSYNNGISTTTLSRMDGPNLRVGIRDASPEYTLSVDHPSGSPDNSAGSRNGFNIENTSNQDSWTFYTRTGATTPTNTQGDLRIYYDSNTQDATNPVLRGTFDAQNGVYTNNSDLRLKKNISTLENQLDKVMKLRPTRYQFKNQEGSNYSLGLIAQEVQKIIPDIVKQVTEMEEDGTDYLGIGYSEFIPVLIGAIQDQQNIIDTQNKEIQSVKAELTEIKNMLKAKK